MANYASGSKSAKSGQGRGGSKLGPKYKKTSTVKSPKGPKAKTTASGGYKAPTAAGSKSCGSTRSGYGDGGAGKVSTKSSYKAPKAGGSK